MKATRNIVVLTFMLGFFCTTVSTQAGEWSIDIKHGCKVWNTNPNKYKKLLFQGDCKDGYANGPGALFFVTKTEGNKEIARGNFHKGAFLESINYYVGKDFPSENLIMQLFDEMEAGSHYIKTLGKYESTKDKYEIYYVYYPSHGKQKINNNMSIIKLDSDQWVMVLNDAKKGSKWSLL